MLSLVAGVVLFGQGLQVPENLKPLLEPTTWRKTEVQSASHRGTPLLHVITRRYKGKGGVGGGQGAAAGHAQQEGQAPIEWVFEGVDEMLLVREADLSDLRLSDLPFKFDQTPGSVTALLGTGSGYRWYGRMYHPLAVITPSWLRFSESDEVPKLAVRGLFVEDPGMGTRNTCVAYLEKKGAAAVPLLWDAFYDSKQTKPELALAPLGRISDPSATAMLMQLYSHPRKEVRQAVVSALHYKPYRKEAKDQYLDILRNVPSGGAARAAAEFGWTEAIEPIQEHLAKAEDFYSYRELFFPLRDLTGEPVSERMSEAVETIIQNGDPRTGDRKVIRESESLLRSFKDKDALIVLAYQLWSFVTKGDRSLANEAGLRLLSTMPDRALEIARKFEKNDSRAKELLKILSG